MTTELKKVVQSILHPIIPQTYYFDVPSGDFPYCTFELRDVRGEEGIDKYVLEINLANYGTDDQTVNDIESLTRQVVNAFDYLRYKNSKLSCYSYVDKIDPIRETDRKINRRRIMINLTNYEV